MNQKIICIEVPEFTFNKLKIIADQNQDELFLLTSDQKRCCNYYTFNVDVRSEYSKAKEIIEKNIGKPSVIFTTQEMFVTQATLLATEFNISQNIPKSTDIFRNKFKMKDIWRQKGVRTPQGEYYKLASEIQQLSYPVILKPSLGYSSCGVKKVIDEQDLREQLKKINIVNLTLMAKESQKDTGFIVEEYLDGKEFSVDTIWYNGNPICSCIFSKGSLLGPYFSDRLYYIDSKLDTLLQQEIISLSIKAVKAIGIGSGATHTEIRFHQAIPYILETACRPGGGGDSYDLFSRATGIDFYSVYYAALISKNEQILVEAKEKMDKRVLSKQLFFKYYIPHKGSGVIQEVNGLDQLRRNRPEILDVFCHIAPGSVLLKDDLNLDYFCIVTGQLPTTQQLHIEDFVKQYDNILQIIYR
ncbi:ATP-grasp domain-containing protein [Thermoactinomyces sp. DSM 45892]|uniref:ATP-grasp domain-containing protein n=1 Tax=Thermoactinomyces sp. DSM 45892 TaxID=1882753 RepID=UPI000894C88D|nr:ATP-grasp domain-containing protein [Thermoactinomyces sp. DSM 45892]SDY23697.1 ATP-grasp domain-containing protein [Thermoactinomyces sp. DSM 45892]